MPENHSVAGGAVDDKRRADAQAGKPLLGQNHAQTQEHSKQGLQGGSSSKGTAATAASHAVAGYSPPQVPQAKTNESVPRDSGDVSFISDTSCFSSVGWERNVNSNVSLVESSIVESIVEHDLERQISKASIGTIIERV
eukprot:TRINITY_DN80321_c0_g1_i1.p1 TRINITY_DN80321_c0_g1~~TRINITY_DN80321_c0_g1_i1.p1  ORF type:complete len:139 (+),score=22.83 TRINITY_DN80321_c0_g1_i1:102-518(+)